MARDRASLAPAASFAMGLTSLILGLALLVPQFAGFYWEELDLPRGTLRVIGGGFQLLALLGLLLGVIALVRKTHPRRLAIAGVVASSAVVVLVLATHLSSA